MTDHEKHIWATVYALHFQARNEKGATYERAATDAAYQADRAVRELRRHGGFPVDV